MTIAMAPVEVQGMVARAKFPALHRETVELAWAAGERLTWPDAGEIFGTAWDVARSGGCVALLGDRGEGKTQLATEIGMAWCAGHGGIPTCRYWRAGDLFAEAIRAQYEASNPIWLARHVGLLILDELQEIKQDSDFNRRELTLLIDHRYADRRPTILISNLTPKGFADLVGTSVQRRIAERGKGIVMKMGVRA